MEPVVVVSDRLGSELARVTPPEFDSFRVSVNGGRKWGSKTYAIGICGADGSPQVLHTTKHIEKLPTGVYQGELLKKERLPKGSPDHAEAWRCV